MVEFQPLFPPISHFNVPMPGASKALRKLCSDTKTKNVYLTYQMIMDCLETHLGTPNTYNSIRGDINLLCNWSWFILGKDVVDLTLKEMNQFIAFCNNPPVELIGKFSSSLIDQQKSDDQFIVINENWKPFVNRNSPKSYKRSESSLKTQLSNLSYMYVFFEDMEYSSRNPAAVAMRRLTSAIKVDLRPDRSEVGHKGMSSLQVSYLVRTLEQISKSDPEKYERSRFLFYLMIFCYPRISEVSARPGYSPVFGDFEMHRGLNNEIYYTFFIPSSKGGKTRKVICAPLVIDALIRYRMFRGLGKGFPLPGDDTPLFVRHRPGTHGRDKNLVDANLGISQIGELVEDIYQKVSDMLRADGYDLDAEVMKTYTPHTMRHTGIQIDLASGRDPRHVMLDAGHSSEATLAIYESKRTERRYQSINNKNAFLDRIIKPEVEPVSLS
ncbi:tyrosine-type recombinase/integrase [Vibrio splendidus]|uniref:tyrosine-type recombinase/integrase n=1 Tax=Vibrio splendidus TaxID=29497 RepID=UPI00352D9B12